MKLSAAFPYKVALAVAVVAGVGFFLLKGRGATNVAADVTSGALGVLGDVGAGIAIGIGDKLGVPRTDMTECERALAEGRTWDASFACPAGKFIGSFW